MLVNAVQNCDIFVGKLEAKPLREEKLLKQLKTVEQAESSLTEGRSASGDAFVGNQSEHLRYFYFSWMLE